MDIARIEMESISCDMPRRDVMRRDAMSQAIHKLLNGCNPSRDIASCHVASHRELERHIVNQT